MKKPAMLLIVMAVAISVFGQYNPKDKVPMDSNVRYGRLPNGLTYYVRHNEKPKDCCSFRIAQDVGAILEENDENGLAHFLEHLCFNGTEHFPGKSIINYFESVGVSFGDGINAYTALDETVYRLSDVPTMREGILDSALLVLYDWSCGVLLQDEEIENISGSSEYIGGYSDTEDFETLLQLMYLTFTAPRMDDKLFNEYIEKKRDDLVSAESSPTHDFYKGLGELEYGHCERYFRLDTNNLKQINQKRAIKIFKERYANPADFTFYIVGDLDINDSTVKANIEKWIGGMKTSKKFEKRIDDGVDIARGTHYYYKKHVMDTKTATNSLTMSGYDIDYTLDNVIMAELMEKF